MAEQAKAGGSGLRRFIEENRSILIRASIYIVVVVAGSNLILLPAFDDTVGAFMRERIAEAASFVISSLGFKARTLGAHVFLSRSSVEIVNSCTGVDVSIFLATAVLVFPASWKEKLWGVLLSVFVVVSLNFVRVLTLCFFIDTNMDLFELTHYYIWPAFIILACLATLLVWIQSLDLDPDA